MPEGFGYGGDEVKATTHNKTVKKATSQLNEEGKLIKRGIGKETPQQSEFRKQVESSVGDPSTRKDVLKAAGMGHLPGAGLTSPAPVPAQQGTPTLRKEVGRILSTKPKPKVERAPGIGQEDTRKYDEVDRASMKRTRDMLKAAGFSAGEITVFLSKSPQARRDHGQSTRSQMREKFLRRKAAEKYGTPP